MQTLSLCDSGFCDFVTLHLCNKDADNTNIFNLLQEKPASGLIPNYLISVTVPIVLASPLPISEPFQIVPSMKTAFTFHI